MFLLAHQRPIDAVETAAPQLDAAAPSAGSPVVASASNTAIACVGQPCSTATATDPDASAPSKRLCTTITPKQPLDAATLESVAQKLR